jgi:nitroreductase
MSLQDAILTRRSIKRFTSREVERAEIEKVIQAAVHAPNHKMTQPWRFYVLGPEARRAYGVALGSRKAKKAADPAAAREVVEKVAEEHRALPAMIAVAMTLAESPEVREEDYAATFMAIQNLILAAHELGLGTHIKTGAVMDDPAARAAIRAAENERVVATIHLGEPAELPPVKPRNEPSAVTIWVP